MTTMDTGAASATPPTGLRAIIELQWFQRFIIAVIVVNAVTLGLETSKSAMSAAGTLILLLDKLALTIFVIEITAKLVVYRLRFFRDPWNIFDFLIVTISLAPASEGLSVLRALRILRALRLISAVPKMRLVVQALLNSIPAMSSVIALLSLLYYIAAVMATKLFGERFPDWFGTIGSSLYSLFQIMTLESWSMGIVRPVMEVYPFAWAFFVPFILIATFAVLNLFIAIVVNSMQDAASAASNEEAAAVHEEIAQVQATEDKVLRELRALRAELADVKAAVARPVGE